MSSDINVQTFSGKVNITSNLLVGTSHLFVDTINNRVGLVTNTPDAGLHVNSNAYVHTDFRVGSGIVMNDTTGRITAGAFHGDGTNITGINSDSGSWVNGTDVVYLSTIGDKVGIGTTGPEALLHVQPTSTNNTFIKAVRHNDLSSTKAIFAVSEYQMTGMTATGTIIGNHNRDIHIGPVFNTGNTVGSSTHGIRIKFDGNVGIGTTSPSAKLEVHNSGAAASIGDLVADFTGSWIRIGDYRASRTFSGGSGIKFYDSGVGHYSVGQLDGKFKISVSSGDGNSLFPSGYTEGITMNTSGNVGIGTSSPGAKLDVNGAVILTGGGHGSRPANDGGVLANAEIRGGPGTGSAGFLRLSGGGYNNGSASDATSKSFIDLCGYSGTTDFDRNISFHTLNQERMRINLSGNVGIGTTSPLSLFTIKSNYSGGESSGLCIDATDGTVYNLRLYSFVQAGSQVGYKFRVNNVSSSVDAMTFGYNGNVGIGTSSPSEKLEIDGGRVKIAESGGGTAANSSAGTLTLRHQNNNGASSIVFPSVGNAGSDYAWIEYDEDGGEGGEAAKLKIGITNDDNDDIMLQTSGGVGITSGTPTSVYHPFGKLEIQDPPSNSGVSNHRCYQSWKYGSGMWALAVDNNTTTNHNLYWYGTNNSSGNLQRILGFENDTANRGTAGIFAFTGQHRNIVTINPSSIESCIGLIVSANNNDNIKVQGGVERGLNAIEINETLPLLSITNTAKDKSVFGVISGSEDLDSRVNKVGRVSNYYDKESGDDRVIINSLGEGAIWITNANGPLESGDYITSSHIPGYGMKQDSDFLANYTVAKITMNCDFLLTPRVKYTIKKELKTLIGYKSEHCLITETEYENIEKDYEKAKYTRQERDENVNILDEYGQLQWEDSSETEAPYKVRYLLPDGTQISEEEYTTKSLANEEVYIAAFVGCTYHCG